MKLIIILSFLFFIISCKKTANKKKEDNFVEKKVFEVRNDSVNERFLNKAIYDTAIFYNNLPTDDLTYLLNEVYPIHFRIGLRNFYKPEDFKKPIPVRETTWEYDDENFITVWYKKEKGIFTPFDVYIYKKGTLF